MANNRQIQSKQIWADGEKTATILALTNFTDYHFDGGTGKVYYSLLGMETKVTESESYQVAVEYYNGIVDIPAEVINQWGASDEVIWAYVCSTLNLILI